MHLLAVLRENMIFAVIWTNSRNTMEIAQCL